MTDRNRPRRTVSVVETDTPPEPHQVSLSASMADPDVTADGPASVAVTFTNLADVERTFEFGAHAPFDGKPSASDTPGLVLLAEGGYEPVAPDCWRPALDDGERLTWLTRLTRVSLPPGGDVTGTLDVWSDPATGGCVEPGRYRFEETYAPPDGSDLDAFTWGFTLAVTDPR